MSRRLALDSNAVISLFRGQGAPPQELLFADEVIIPLPVLGELYAGVYGSIKKEHHMPALEAFVSERTVLAPDVGTARDYGVLRAQYASSRLRLAKINDLWIAALCLQHNLPLLTNDRGFDTINGLDVIHW